MIHKDTRDIALQLSLTLPDQGELHQDDQNAMLHVHCLTIAGNVMHTARRCVHKYSLPLALKEQRTQTQRLHGQTALTPALCYWISRGAADT